MGIVLLIWERVKILIDCYPGRDLFEVIQSITVAVRMPDEFKNIAGTEDTARNIESRVSSGPTGRDPGNGIPNCTVDRSADVGRQWLKGYRSPLFVHDTMPLCEPDIGSAVPAWNLYVRSVAVAPEERTPVRRDAEVMECRSVEDRPNVHGLISARIGVSATMVILITMY